jgi:hypothetical protein
MQWIKKMLDEAYTIIDMGDPLGLGISIFYNAEKKLLGWL